MTRTIIVGGVAGGMSAATRLRRLDETMEIVVLERGEHVSFANCGLPYFVGGVIEDRSALLLQTPSSLRSRFALDVRIRHEAVSVDRAARTVIVRDLATGREQAEPYDHLIFALGAAPRAQFPVASGAVPVVTLRTVPDVDRIDGVLRSLREPGRAIVVGAGFIGLEAVENLVRRGLEVVLVQHGAQPLSPLDVEMAGPVLDELRRNGVAVRTRTEVVRIGERAVHLDDGSELGADLVIDARGVRPEVRLAEQAGLALGLAGGIVVDGWQRTSDPRILAVGDAVEKPDAVSGGASLVTMAGLANRHGRSAADAIVLGTGDLAPAPPALGTAIIGVFDLTVAMLGWSERRLRAAGRPHRVLHTHPSDHAGYYPGAERMAMKLLVSDEDDRILGAQIVGGRGVDKRIDVLAVAMHAGLTASALSQLELAYAPQYGSAKDPINLLGYVAENAAEQRTGTIQWHELDTALAAGAHLLDVRSPAEHAAGAIPGSINAPLDTLRDAADGLPEGPLIVHCQVGQRGHTAARLLSQLGRDVRNLDGGYLTWSAARILAPQESA